MDAISDRIFTEVNASEAPNDDPSLLTIILDMAPQSWYKLQDQISIQDLTKSLLVFLNAHLALNNSNQVAFIASAPHGSKFLYPNPNRNYDENSGKEPSPGLINPGMYRQFRIVDEAVIEDLKEFIEEIEEKTCKARSQSTLAGALSMALTYTNRMLTLDQSISTTTASAINSTTNNIANTGPNSSSNSASGTSSNSLTSMKSRILIVSANDDDNIKYIPIMNSIFAAQKMKLSIDVAKLGSQNSSYLQQAADATDGIYLNIGNPQGLIQVLSTAYFIEPSLRSLIILPTNSNVNYRASCFITGKSVDLGFVCSVCLCIMSIIPENGECPTCASTFDNETLNQLRREPIVASRKKRKVETNGTSS